VQTYPDNGGVSFAILARFRLAGQEMEALIAVSSDGGLRLASSWENREHPLGIVAVARGFHIDLSSLSSWDVDIEKLGIGYDFSKKELALSMESARYGKLSFTKGQEQWELLFALGKGVRFAQIPLIGNCFDDKSGLEITSLRVADFPDDTGDTASAKLTLNLLGKDWTFSLPLSFKEKNALTASPSGKEENALTASPSGKVNWLSVNKRMGFFSLYRLGFTMEDSRAYLYVEAGLALSLLQVTLEGLYFSMPLSLSFKDAEYGLSGLTVSIETKLLSIGGGLVKIPGDALIYGGTLTFRVGKFSLSAYGFYRSEESYSSFFVYLLVNYPLGGPPAFFVTGLAAAVGFHYNLLLPDVKHVSEFPLVKAAAGQGGPLKPDSSLSQLLDAFGECLSPAPDTTFGAFGISFDTFGVLHSVLLATAAIGPEMEFSLLGQSELSVPPATPDPIVYCKIQLRCGYSTASGILSLEAALAPESHLFSKSCKLTGGLAAVFWTKGEQKGDFVISLGGYREGYDKPARYPDVDRLGISWKIGDNLSLTGSAYFALLPDRVMAGGKLRLTFQAGPLSAWFSLCADMLLEWKPLHYDFTAQASIGVSLRVDFLFIHKTFSVELSAGLHLYGPEFSGEIHIHLFFISFTVSFGNGSKSAPPRLSWEEFSASFLTSGENSGESLLKLSPSDGVSRRTPDGGFVLLPQKAALSLSLQIPATEISFGNRKETSSSAFGIKPMGVDFIRSEVILSVSSQGEGRFSLTPESMGLPSAIWGGSEGLLKGTLTGAVLRPLPPEKGHRSPEKDYYELRVQQRIVKRLDASRSLAGEQERVVRTAFLEAARPVLPTGKYRLEAQQKVQRENGEELYAGKASLTFHVAGDRFRLPPEDVQSLYPPKGSAGEYDGVLPHILLKNPGFLWESEIGEGIKGPAAALLLFPEDSGELFAKTALDELVRVSPGWSSPHIVPDAAIGETGETDTLLLPMEVFLAACPRPSDLPYTAHIREFPAEGRAAGQPDTLACLCAAVPPEKGRERTYTACMVSLAGYGWLLWRLEKNGWRTDASLPPAVRMVSLCRWSFTNREDPCPFAVLFDRLSFGWLRPELPEGDPNKQAQGFVPLTHILPDGREEPAWYRGPLCPAAGVSDSVRGAAGAGVSLSKTSGADFLETETSRTDATETGTSRTDAPETETPETGASGDTALSLETARELGKLLALRDTSFASLLVEHRSQGVARALQSFALERAGLSRGPEGPAAFFAGEALAHIQGVPSPQNAVQRQERTKDLVSAFLEHYRRADAFCLEDNALEEADPLEEEIARWLSELSLLKPIPLRYLLPHASMLPPESFRAFLVDRDWLDAAGRGALSVGSSGEADELHDQSAASRLLGQSGPRSGFLLRSALTGIWAGLQVSVYDKTGASLPILRMELLGGDILLCLCEGIFSRAEVRQPAGEIHFSLYGPAGKAERPLRSPKDGQELSGTFTVQRRKDGSVDFLSTAKAMERTLGCLPTPDLLALQLLGDTAMGVVETGEPTYNQRSSKGADLRLES